MEEHHGDLCALQTLGTALKGGVWRPLLKRVGSTPQGHSTAQEMLWLPLQGPCSQRCHQAGEASLPASQEREVSLWGWTPGEAEQR